MKSLLLNLIADIYAFSWELNKQRESFNEFIPKWPIADWVSNIEHFEVLFVAWICYRKYFRDMKLILLFFGGVLSSCSQSICFKVMINDSSWYFIFYLSARQLFKAKSSMELWPVNAINIFHAIIIAAKVKAHNFKQVLVKLGYKVKRPFVCNNINNTNENMREYQWILQSLKLDDFEPMKISKT